MGNSQSVSGQVGVGSHVPGDTVNKRVDTKREQRPDPSQTVETDKSSSRSDSEKEIEETEVPDPSISYILYVCHLFFIYMLQKKHFA